MPCHASASRSTSTGRRLSLSNLDKVLYPQAGFTKGQVIDYYTRIAPYVLPHLRGRAADAQALSERRRGRPLLREAVPEAPRRTWVRTRASMRPKAIDFCVCDDLPTLVWLANLADLELHPSLAQIARHRRRPAILAFDLDPGPPATIVECAEVAVRLRAALRSIGLECFPKTSGSKGMQVYAPLNTPTTYHGDARRSQGASRSRARARRARPRRLRDEEGRCARGKVFVDWSQNARAQDDGRASTRCARWPRPTVSTPITWDEVEAVRVSGDPEDLVFTSDRCSRASAEHGDLFAPVAELRQTLPT